MCTLEDHPSELGKLFAFLKEDGYTGLCVSKDNGGKGYTYLQSAMAYEGIAYGDPIAGLVLQLHDSNILSLEQVGDQVAEVVQECVSGKKLLAFAFTEETSGSDPSGNLGKAIKKEGSYHLSGEKHWTTLGASAGYFMTFLSKSEERGMYLFLLDKDSPGLKTRPMQPLACGNMIGANIVDFNGCVVPETNMLSEDGYRLGLLGIDIARIFVPALCVGLAQRALDETVSFLRTRYSMKSTILEKSSIQFELAEMDAKIEAARRLLYYTATALDMKDPRFSLIAAKNKLFAPAVAQEMAGKCVQLHGGQGLYQDSYPARALNCSRMFSIMDGTSEIQKFIIGRKLGKEGGVMNA